MIAWFTYFTGMAHFAKHLDIRDHVFPPDMVPQVVHHLTSSQMIQYGVGFRYNNFMGTPPLYFYFWNTKYFQALFS